MTTMDRQTLIERLRGIEWDDFEVKEATGGLPKNAYETVSAFANTSGGWIVLGVRESKPGFEVVGVPDPDAMQNDFLGACRSVEKFSRPVEVRPHHFSLDGSSVLAFYVAAARRFDKPVRVRIDKAWHTYVRLGAGDHRCTPEEEGRFLRDASAETFDTQVLEKARLQDLDPATLRWGKAAYASRHPDPAAIELTDTEFLDELGLLPDGQLLRAAALLFGRPKLIARLKPAGIVDFLQFRTPVEQGMPAHRYDDRRLCEVNILETYRTIVSRFLDLVPNPFALDPATLQREAHPPEHEALREALVNLLIHQDYSDQHRTARVLWHSDAIVFDNPGDSFVSVAEMLAGGASDLRNPRLTRVMRQLGFADQIGTGLPTIIRTWATVDRIPPKIENDADKKRFRLTLGWPILSKPGDPLWDAFLGVRISAPEFRVVAWLHREGVADRSLARLATGESAIATREILDHLEELRLIESVGSDRGHLRLTKLAMVDELDRSLPLSGEQRTRPVTQPVTQPVGPPLGQPVEALLLLLRREGQLGAKAIREGLGLRDRAHVREAYVRPALEAGLVEQTRPEAPHSRLQEYRLTEAGRALLAHGLGDRS